MGFVDFLKSIFGSKSDRDLREIRPILDSILAIYPEMEKLSNDELRAKIDEVKAQLRASVQEKRDKVQALKEEVETLDYEQREPLWEEIDRLNKAIVDNAQAGAIPRYFVKDDGSINLSEYEDLSKQFVHVEGNIGEENIRPIDHKHLDGIYFNILQQKIDELKYVTSNQDVNNGAAPSGVTSASGIAAIIQ